MVDWISGTNDDTGTFSSMASLTYLTADQLLSGDFGKCGPGIIGVSASFKQFTGDFLDAEQWKSINRTMTILFRCWLRMHSKRRLWNSLKWMRTKKIHSGHLFILLTIRANTQGRATFMFYDVLNQTGEWRIKFNSIYSFAK